LNKLIRNLEWAIGYFPIRLLIAALFFSYIFLTNVDAIKHFENQLLEPILQFFAIPAYQLDGSLFVGSFIAPVEFVPEITVQSLFFVFLLSVVSTAKTSILIRTKILLFTGLMFVVFIIGQVLTIATLLAIGNATTTVFTQVSLVVTSLTAGGVVELALFSTFTLPKSSKITPAIKRNYVEEYVIIAGLLIASFLALYFFLNVFGIKDDSVASAYAAANISSILAFKYYLSYFIYEVMPPRWAKWKDKNGHGLSPPVSFLLPAFNEAVTIRRLIESIDRAAAKYSGKVEIVLVNDGSTDGTDKIAAEAFRNLKNATYKQFDIPNAGKGHALKFGLKYTTGGIIFRIDADSLIHEDAIGRIVDHFEDPTVGSVSGMILPIEEKSIWQKSMVLLGCIFVYYKRGQELIDSIMCQPGAFSVFRKEALEKAGGWADNQFGEDGEITVRLGRYGYRANFEQHAIVFSEAPRTLQDVRHQRLRWAIAYYYARSKNVEIIKEFRGPRSIIFFFQLLKDGGLFVHSVFWPFFIMSGILGISTITPQNVSIALGVPLQVAGIQLLWMVANLVVYSYFLIKFKRASYLKYIPFMMLLNLILSTFVKPEALGLLLSYSSKHKIHRREGYEIFRKHMMKGF
jgi:cellulose synthase/poly-beta-1,6-N-acetylglucosamine synthase-like glycosyltransferase